LWTWHLHQHFDQNQSIRQDWERLHRESEFPTVFGLFSFHQAAFENRRQNWTLKTLVGRDDSGLVRIIAPFAAANAQPLRWRFAIPDACDYDCLLFQKGDRQAALELGKWLQSNSNWDRLELQSLAGGREELGALAPHFVKRAHNRLKNGLGVLFGEYPVSYEIPDCNHPYLTAQALSAQADALGQKQYERNLRWFRKQRPLHLETLATPEAILAGLPRFAQLHCGQWGDSAKGALVPGGQGLDLLERLTRAENAEYPVRLSVLKWGEEWIAAHFGFEWQRRFYWFLPAYDVALSQRAPGRLLLAHLLQSVARQGNTEFDFLRGNESYKLNLTTTNRPTSRLHTFRTRASALRSALERIHHVRIINPGGLLTRLGSLFAQRHHAGGKSPS
jgi:hypothetical protein